MSAIGDKARAIAEKKTLNLAKKVNLTPARVLKTISQELTAFENKMAYDKEKGEWSYSKKLIAHGPRLQAAGLAADILKLKPSENSSAKEIPINLKIEVEFVGVKGGNGSEEV